MRCFSALFNGPSAAQSATSESQQMNMQGRVGGPYSNTIFKTKTTKYDAAQF